MKLYNITSDCRDPHWKNTPHYYQTKQATTTHQQPCRPSSSHYYYHSSWRKEGKERVCQTRNRTYFHLPFKLKTPRPPIYLRLLLQLSRRGAIIDTQARARRLSHHTILQCPKVHHRLHSLQNPESGHFLMFKRNLMRGRRNSIC